MPRMYVQSLSTTWSVQDIQISIRILTWNSLVYQVDKVKAEAKLEAARPALEEAEAALQTLKPAHIATGQSRKHITFRISMIVVST